MLISLFNMTGIQLLRKDDMIDFSKFSIKLNCRNYSENLISLIKIKLFALI